MICSIYKKKNFLKLCKGLIIVAFLTSSSSLISCGYINSNILAYTLRNLSPNTEYTWGPPYVQPQHMHYILSSGQVLIHFFFTFLWISNKIIKGFIWPYLSLSVIHFNKINTTLLITSHTNVRCFKFFILVFSFRENWHLLWKVKTSQTLFWIFFIYFFLSSWNPSD